MHLNVHYAFQKERDRGKKHHFDSTINKIMLIENLFGANFNAG